MPIQVQPNEIELSDFSSGWFGNSEAAAVPPNGLCDVEDLMPEVSTGALVSRKGYARLFETTGLAGWRIRTLNPYMKKNGTNYLIAVLTNDTNAANNVKVYACTLAASPTWTRIDTVGKTWASSTGRHWGAVIDDVYYGGGEGDKMYSWNGTTWNADPGTPVWWTYAGTKRPADYAFQQGDPVSYTYTPPNDSQITLAGFMFKYDDNKAKSDGLRWPKWESAKRYKYNDKVSVHTTTVDVAFGGDTKHVGIWKTFICIKANGDDNDATKDRKPGLGANTTYWTKVTAPPPIDEDGLLEKKYWERIPDAPQTRVAVWHGDRLFARNDVGMGGKSTLVYSRLAKVGQREAGTAKDRADIIGAVGNPVWDPADWRGGGSSGGGLQPFETKEGDDIIALHSLGYYLLVFKRYSTWVIAGLNPDTWTIRELAPVGAVFARATTEHDGVVYFISDRGFYQTDGTQVTPVAGSEKLDKFFRKSIDWNGAEGSVLLFSFNGFVWISLPTESDAEPNIIVLYEATTQSFWKQNISVSHACVIPYAGVDRLYFGASPMTGTLSAATYDFGTYATDGTWTTDNTGTKSARRRRASRRSLSGTPTYNIFGNVSFESDTQWGAPANWPILGGVALRFGTYRETGRFGREALQITNLEKVGSTNGISASGWDGVYQSLNFPTGTYNISVYCRRANWKDNWDLTPAVKFINAGALLAADVKTYLGHGWFRYSASITKASGAKNFGFAVAPKAEVHFDGALLTPTAIAPWFDGFGGTDTATHHIGGNKPLIMQYGTTNTGATILTDDTGTYENDGSTVYTNPITWEMRTAWLPFGAVKEERRIRRTWALVRSGANIAVGTAINFVIGVDTKSLTTVDADSSTAIYAENLVPADAYAVQFRVSGSGSSSAVHAVGADTQPRRLRYSS